MKLRCVTLTNYGPFKGDLKFSLENRGLMLILGDNRDEPRMNSNGSGKSSLVEALDWCLYGQVPRGDAVDSIVHKGCSDCAVFVELEDDDGIAVGVRRAREGGSSKLTLKYDGHDVTTLDAKETQRSIESHLGMDRQVFHSTVLFAQTDMFAFADATDAERMGILTKILRLEDIDAWLEGAKRLVKEATEKKVAVEHEIATIDGQLQSPWRVSLVERVRGWEADRENRLRDLGQQCGSISKQIEDHKAQQTDTRVLQERLAALRQPIAPPNLEGLQAARVKHTEQLNSAQAIMHSKLGIKARVDALLKLGEVCPECEQPITQATKGDYAKRQDEAEAMIGKARELVDGFSKVVGDIVLEIENRKEQYQSDLRERQEQIAAAERALSAQELIETQVAAMTSHRERLFKERDDLQGASNPWAEQEAEGLAQEHRLTVARDAKNAEHSQLDVRGRALVFWVDAFGQKGIKSYVLDSRLQEMTDAANHWVKLLTGGTIWVRLETTTPTKAGAVRNKFNIRVFRQEPSGAVTERNYKSWSGGERQRVRLGIDFGLSRLVAKRARKPYDLLILDEIFRDLDASGREAVMEMLQHLRREKSTILVVDHDAEFQAMFERCVIVRKEHGCAQIIEESHGTVAPDQAGALRGDTPATKAKPRAAKRHVGVSKSAARNRGRSRQPVGGERSGDDAP